VFSFRDLTERLDAQKRIEALAYTDALTGLPNRLLLGQRVAVALRAAQRSGVTFAIMYIDLDRFKNINDSLGHTFGDRALMEAASRIQQTMREVDTLCRVGGDEFIAFLQEADAIGAEIVARRILESLSQPFVVDAVNFSLGCSIGLAMYPADARTLDALIQCADTAMFRVKERGRGNFRFYQPQMNVDLLARVKLDHAMRQAMEQGLFRLHYQPQISLCDGRLVGVEALIRWSDAELGNVSPAAFIPLAEESGFIITIGNWVLQEAVHQALVWQLSGRPVVVSVNVSAMQFQQGDFVERVASAIGDAGLNPALLELELTESILIKDINETLSRLHALASLGVSLAIDDFGTGYSSLAYLKKFPISKLKIDRAFVMGLPDDEGDRAIVSATIAMARALKLTVVAEGVETVAQRDYLQSLHCDVFQGFLCAPGLPAVELERLHATLPTGPAPV
jgi:diguanylate cyclase (GGDEF)-like protein